MEFYKITSKPNYDWRLKPTAETISVRNELGGNFDKFIKTDELESIPNLTFEIVHKYYNKTHLLSDEERNNFQNRPEYLLDILDTDGSTEVLGVSRRVISEEMRNSISEHKSVLFFELKIEVLFEKKSYNYYVIYNDIKDLHSSSIDYTKTKFIASDNEETQAYAKGEDYIQFKDIEEKKKLRFEKNIRDYGFYEKTIYLKSNYSTFCIADLYIDKDLLLEFNNKKLKFHSSPISEDTYGLINQIILPTESKVTENEI